jgi:Coenzyme PQQ synthesis protein D (PqqD)
MTWRIGPQVAWQVVAGEAVVMDLASGRTVGLNATGTFIWTRIESEAPGSIATSLASEYQRDASESLMDVQDFISNLLEQNLIVEKS